jgi:branched-subunit amino acid transport protein
VSLWGAVLLASGLVYSWKLIGYLIPERFLESPQVKSLATLLTVSLMAALVGIQTFVSAEGVSLDARIPAVILAGVMFWLRVPFVVVVFSAALFAAGLRLFF